MPLIDLKTDLKSLKYGKDRPGGGDSGQPYQKVDINKVDSGFNRFRLTNFDDGLVRGGVVGAANAAIVDTLRIGKFLKDFPKGPLFITKQIGLQLSNPIIEHKTDFPTNRPTRGQGLFNNIGNFVSNTANKILNAVGPTRIYNLGINTLAQIPVNAFGQHIQRHGFTPRRNDDNLYFKVAQYNNNEGNNRLTQLRSILGNTNNINTYISGPSSVYGIGATIIQRRGKFIDINRDITASVWATSKTVNDSSYVQSSAKNLISTSNLKIGADLGLSRKTFSKLAGNLNIPIDPSGSAAYDRIALKSDPKNITYSAVGQEAIASAKMRTPNEFIGASTKTSSLFAPGGFPDLTSATNKPQTLDDKTISTYNQTLVGSSVSASNDLGVSKQYFQGSTPDLPKPDITTYSQIVRGDIPLQIINGNTVDPASTIIVQSNTPIANASYNKYKRIIDSKKLREKTYTVDGNQVNAFGIYSAGGGDIVGGAIYNGLSPSSTEYPVYSNGDKIVKINIPWNKVDRAERVGSGLRDKINLTPLLDLAAGTQGDVLGGFNVNDLVKFRIQALNGDNPNLATYMIFRAYITQFSDNTDANWNEIKYAGRGDKFYIYDGFSRKIQIGFKVAALSAEEMEPMYQKLNYLMGNVMPDYKDGLLMRGPLVKMTVGNWIDGQDGILNSVSYTIPQDSPWEIALNEPLPGGSKELILPHIVEVSMTFTPIGSQTKGKNLISQKSKTTSHIAQNINDYQFIK
jgi:hypothetical protein